MKRIGIIISMLVMAMGVFAQDKSADEFKNEGNEFVRNKQYQQALESYKQAISLWGEDADAATLFNAAQCAQKTKESELAMDLYTQAREKGYKPAEATYAIAQLYKAQNNEEKYFETLETGYKTYTEGKAANLFKKDLGKYYRDKGLALYNEGAGILKSAQTASADKYDEIKANAKEKFAAAKPLVEKALEINPGDQNAKVMMQKIETNLAAQ